MALEQDFLGNGKELSCIIDGSGNREIRANGCQFLLLIPSLGHSMKQTTYVSLDLLGSFKKEEAFHLNEEDPSSLVHLFLRHSLSLCPSEGPVLVSGTLE